MVDIKKPPKELKPTIKTRHRELNDVISSCENYQEETNDSIEYKLQIEKTIADGILNKSMKPINSTTSCELKIKESNEEMEGYICMSAETYNLTKENDVSWILCNT